MRMKYSAEEIRDAILKLKAFQEDKMTLLRIEDMLNQAADMVDRANNAIRANSKDLEAENARLRAALNPVLEVRPRIRGDYVKYKCWDPDEMMEAIVESQRIYSGGEA